MRELQSIEQERLICLNRGGLRFGLIQPTVTALDKKIMDATQPLREFLQERKIHDFASQGQGEENKVVISTKILSEGRWVEAPATLYRPRTKKGDPRIWFSRLNHFVGPNNILAVIERERQLYIVNLTHTPIEESLVSGPLSELVDNRLPSVATELLGRLNALARLGALRSIAKGDMAVGKTIEAALGISANSSRDPDYKGIELKSTRAKVKNKANLFAQVPDWDISDCKGFDEILSLFGYFRNGKDRLNCTVSASTFNSQGLKLCVDERSDHLIGTSQKRKDFIRWRLAGLRESLRKKHGETFWINVTSEFQDDIEYFTMTSIEYTKNPNVTQFGPLLAAGAITVDHLISRLPNGGVRERGPLFKIKKARFDALFTPGRSFTLDQRQ